MEEQPRSSLPRPFPETSSSASAHVSSDTPALQPASGRTHASDTLVSASLISISSDSTSTPSASTTLRFPKPEGSRLLASWVKSSSDPASGPAPESVSDTASESSPTEAHDMPPSDDGNSLADSAYELISSTDGESQDGHGDDSLADSVDLYPRADDVQSLSGNDTGYDDDEESTFHADGDHEDSEDDEYESGNQAATRTKSTPSQSFQLAGRSVGGRDGSEDSLDRRDSDSSIRYTEHVLGSPSAHQSVSGLDYESAPKDITSTGPTLDLFPSIEFNEASDIGVRLEKVSVKHTIRKFSEEETEIIAQKMRITNPPKRLVATVRQTMSHHCLSTREPLRVLYVGSDAGYNEIMYKISTALLASDPAHRAGGESGGTAGSNTGVSGTDSTYSASFTSSSHPSTYNIIPISAFGSTKVPEIDEIQLMGVSDYYIKVDRCAKAEETIYEGDAFPNETIYSITLDNEKTHLSIFCPSGSVVHPQWTLPHVAVFFVSANDDEEAQKTRNAAWEFMTRHAVPSIFISNTQSFSAQSFTRSIFAGRWQDFVDQAAVHMCLESREPGRHMEPERLPIDLGSFLNIDARQMNRNLAYLTGLYDSPDMAAKTDEKPRRRGRSAFQHLVEGLRLMHAGNDPRDELYHAVDEAWLQMRTQNWRPFVVVLLSTIISFFVLLSPSLLSVFRSSQIGTLPQPWSAPTLCLTRTPIALTPDPPTAATTPVCSVPTQTPTITISLTSTKTVKLRVTESTTTTTTALFGGFLTDKAHQQQNSALLGESEIKRPGCSIQLYSNHEILVKVPASTKTTWLAKGAIDIDVWRGQELLKSKLSTTDEGIIIEINKKDAYGVMNVSIVTTRRPKMNETFAVDFGKPSMAKLLDTGADLWRQSMEAVTSSGRYAAAYAENTFHAYTDDVEFPWSAQEVMDGVASAASSMVSSVASTVTSSAESSVKEGRKQADKLGHAAGEAALSLADRARQAVQEKYAKVRAEAQEKIKDQTAVGLEQAEQAMDAAALSVLRAQIASKLWWLQLQGRTAEHDKYKAKATEFLADKEKVLASIAKQSKKQESCQDDKMTGWRRTRLAGRTGRKNSGCSGGRPRGHNLRNKWNKGGRA